MRIRKTRSAEQPSESATPEEPALWRLVYVSDAKPSMSDDELDHILFSARTRNFFMLDLTGMLMLVGGRFCQIVEGSLESINELLERLNRDPRHSNIRVLALETIPARSFPNWTMGPPSRSLREFSEAADVEEFFSSMREPTSRPSRDVLAIMTQFHSGGLQLPPEPAT